MYLYPVVLVEGCVCCSGLLTIKHFSLSLPRNAKAALWASGLISKNLHEPQPTTRDGLRFDSILEPQLINFFISRRHILNIYILIIDESFDRR